MKKNDESTTAAPNTLRHLEEELESWAEIYISSRDESSAHVARKFMLKAHSKFRAECKRITCVKSARMRGKGYFLNAVASARSVPIELVLERYFGQMLDRHGRGKCPFHCGRNPQSLHKLPSGNRVFCHVCQRSWDPVGALMTIKGIDFRRAVEILANI